MAALETSNVIEKEKNTKKKLLKLEAIRGFAAVYTVLHHTFSLHNPSSNKFSTALLFHGKDYGFIFRFGQEAVILFFLLSGFVIQYAYELSTDKSFKIFFSKRFLRIYIPLICIFIANYLLVCLKHHGFIPVNWTWLAENFLMLQDAQKPNIICEPFLRNLPLWSLSYEWWFYMMFFVVINFIKKKPSFIVYGVSIIAAITYILYPNVINRELMYFAIWWVGADMAKLYINNEAITLKTLIIPLSALVLCTVIMAINIKVHAVNQTIGDSPYLEFRHFFFASIAVVIAILWSKLKWIGFNKTIGLFEGVAPISFGIYISHWFLISRATYLDAYVANVYLKFLCYAIVCLLLSYLVERVIYVKLNKAIMKRIKN